MFKFLLMVSCSLLLNEACFAQENNELLFSLSFEELLKVQITGSTNTPEGLAAVPSAVTVFTHQEISLMGLDSLDELMNFVPGFQSYRSAASSLDSLFSSRARRIGNSASEVLILVDGQRMEEPRSSGSAIILSKFPLAYIQRVEFFRGPNAAMYGSNAMMGVINIVTRSDANEIDIGYGSFDRRTASLLWSENFKNISFDFLSHIEKDNGDVYFIQDTFGQDSIYTNDPRQLADFNLKIKWRELLFNAQHYEFNVKNFYELGGISNDYNSRKGSLDSISLNYDFAWHDVESSLWLSYIQTSFESKAQFTTEGELQPYSSPSNSDPLFSEFPFSNYSELRLLSSNKLYLTQRSGLQFGMELRKINAPEVLAKSNFNFGDVVNQRFPISYYGAPIENTLIQKGSNRHILGVFTQYQGELGKATALTLGLRYDHFSSIGASLSPRIALVHKVNETHSFKILYGEAFRAPAESELFIENNPRVQGNENLEPEVVFGSELIWVGQWAHTELSFGYFKNYFRDAIVQEVIEGIIRYDNVSQAPSQGFELELSKELLTNLLVRMHFTHILQKPDISFRETDQIASVSANYQHRKWNINLNVLFTSQREIATNGSSNNRIKLASYSIVSGKLSYNLTKDRQFYFKAKNLLSTDYSTPPASAEFTTGVPNRGRELLLGFKWLY